MAARSPSPPPCGTPTGHQPPARLPAFAWLVLALLAAAPLLACYGPEYESVHFHSDRPDFLQMPHPWSGIPHETRALAHGEDVSTYYRGGNGPPRSAAISKEALALEAAGKFGEAARVWGGLRPALREEADTFDATGPPQAQGIEDRVEALRSWRGPGDSAAVQAYLKARDLASAGQYRAARAALGMVTGEELRDRVEYLRAGLLFHESAGEESAAAFRTILRRRPGDVLAHYMVGRSYFAPVYQADPDGDVTVSKAAQKLTPAERLRYLKAALAAYNACAAMPRAGSVGRDAAGMAAACLYRLEDYPNALIRYCRQLAALPAGQEDARAWISAQWCLKKMGPAEHRAFQKLAVAEPGTAAVYLDLLLHYHRLAQESNYRLGLFALEVLKQHPQAPVTAPILSRLALIEDRAGHYARAEKLAATSVARGAPGAERDAARWQHALALHHLTRDRDALQEYERLASGAVVPHLRRGAHEAAAVLCEKLADYPAAMRHYFALEYQLDYGYVIDCLASQDDLRAFLKRYPDHPRAKLVRYSLGFRQLRAGQYDEAAKTFGSLGPWLEAAEKKFDCSTSRDGPRMPPLATAKFLAAQGRAEAQAKTPEEKAQVAYETGRFLFKQRHLVLYNGALWTGSRTSAFQIQERHNVQDPNAPPDPREERAYGAYQHEHAALYQALQVFERIARDYPKTPEAPKALYSAALCCTFLPSLEAYWREDDPKLTAKAIGFYRRIQRDYPSDPLAKDAARYGGPLAGAPAAEAGTHTP